MLCKFRKSFLVLIALSLLLTGMMATPAGVKAYGVATYTLNCPIYSVTGWTDAPFQNSLGTYYVMENITNLTRGQSFTTSANVTTKMRGFEHNIDLSLIIGLTFLPGDTLRIRVWDRYSELLNVTVVCGTSTGGGVPSGYVMRTITCTVPVLNSPSGSPLTDGLGNPIRVEAGTRRYVLLLGVIGPDGLPWHKVRVSYLIYGYIRSLCVGAS